MYFDITARTAPVTRKFSSIAGAVKKSRKNGSNGSITKIWKEILTSSSLYRCCCKSLMHNSRKSLIYKTTTAADNNSRKLLATVVTP